MTAEDKTMPTAEPKDLMEVLARLEEQRQDPEMEKQRKFRRFIVRGEAKLEPLTKDSLTEPTTIERDVRLNGELLDV